MRALVRMAALSDGGGKRISSLRRTGWDALLFATEASTCCEVVGMYISCVDGVVGRMLEEEAGVYGMDKVELAGLKRVWRSR